MNEGLQIRNKMMVSNSFFFLGGGGGGGGWINPLN